MSTLLDPILDEEPATTTVSLNQKFDVEEGCTGDSLSSASQSSSSESTATLLGSLFDCARRLYCGRRKPVMSTSVALSFLPGTERPYFWLVASVVALDHRNRLKNEREIYQLTMRRGREWLASRVRRVPSHRCAAPLR